MKKSINTASDQFSTSIPVEQMEAVNRIWTLLEQIAVLFVAVIVAIKDQLALSVILFLLARH